MSQSLTYADIAEHKTKKDLYMVVHDKVYNASNFVDEHPGGEEVLVDVGGQDATEAFEDVGHSDEAREILNGLLIGDLKRIDGDPPKKDYNTANASLASKSSQSSGPGISVVVAGLVGLLLAFVGYQYVSQQSSSK